MAPVAHTSSSGAAHAAATCRPISWRTAFMSPAQFMVSQVPRVPCSHVHRRVPFLPACFNPTLLALPPVLPQLLPPLAPSLCYPQLPPLFHCLIGLAQFSLPPAPPCDFFAGPRPANRFPPPAQPAQFFLPVPSAPLQASCTPRAPNSSPCCPISSPAPPHRTYPAHTLPHPHFFPTFSADRCCSALLLEALPRCPAFAE